MVTMLPDIISPEIKSPAEKKLFISYRQHVTDEKIIVLHSLGVAEHVNNIFGEIDFVIICKEGFLCVEVKGGIVERNAGNWSFVNRYGKRATKPIGPFLQAQGNMQSLRMYMKKRLGKTSNLYRAQYATCVLMPDCTFNYDGFDIQRQVLFDQSTGCDLGRIIHSSFDYWRSECLRQHNFEGGYLSDYEIQSAADLLRGDFKFVPSLKEEINNTYLELLALTDEQYEVLEALEDNPRLLISGLAGTGKSVLAIEQCKRACRCTKSVLYLCFNKNMAQYAQNQFDKENLSAEACTLHSFMSRTCGLISDEDNSEWFTSTLPTEFIKNSKIVPRYDFVAIDEGQDLINATYLNCIELVVKQGLKDGSWVVYYDPNQNIYNKSSEMAAQLPVLKSMATNFNLTINCRNTKEIANANTLITNIPQASKVKASGPSHELFKYNSINDEHRQIVELIEQIRNEGVRLGDVVILSAYSKNSTRCFLSHGTLLNNSFRLKTDGKMWGAKQNEIRFSTISAFKGLEAKVIILADVDSFDESSRRLLNYVGISRAEVSLYVFYSNTVEDERQRMLIEGYSKLK